MRTDADVTFSPVYGLMGTKQDKTAATPDNTHFSWRDENIKRIWFKVIWEDETESDAIGLARCEHARLVFSKTAAPQKQRIRIKEDEEDARGPDQQRQVALTVNAGACDVVH